MHELAVRLNQEGWCAHEAVVTVGGLVAARLGRIPAVGEELEIEGVRLRVLSGDHRATHRVRVTPPTGGRDPSLADTQGANATDSR